MNLLLVDSPDGTIPRMGVCAVFGDADMAKSSRSVDPFCHRSGVGPALKVAVEPTLQSHAMTDLIKQEQRDGVLTLTIDRPDKLNALNNGMYTRWPTCCLPPTKTTKSA